MSLLFARWAWTSVFISVCPLSSSQSDDVVWKKCVLRVHIMCVRQRTGPPTVWSVSLSSHLHFAPPTYSSITHLHSVWRVSRTWHMGICGEQGPHFLGSVLKREGRVLFPRKGKESIVIEENQRVVPVEVGEVARLRVRTALGSFCRFYSMCRRK